MMADSSFLRNCLYQIRHLDRGMSRIRTAVARLCAAALVLCYLSGDTAGVVEAANAYIGYATIAFAAYSGNSAVEKWLTRKYGSVHTSETETTESNG